MHTQKYIFLKWRNWERGVALKGFHENDFGSDTGKQASETSCQATNLRESVGAQCVRLMEYLKFR